MFRAVEGGDSRTASATARKSLRRIAPWLPATFALTSMFGLRVVAAGHSTGM
ncbi:hypothetical protein [Kribbella swartbergensis]